MVGEILFISCCLIMVGFCNLEGIDFGFMLLLEENIFMDVFFFVYLKYIFLGVIFIFNCFL